MRSWRPALAVLAGLTTLSAALAAAELPADDQPYTLVPLAMSAPAGASLRASIDDAGVIRIRVSIARTVRELALVWDGQAATMLLPPIDPSTSQSGHALLLRALRRVGALPAQLARSDAGDAPGSRFDAARGRWIACVWLDSGDPIDLPAPSGAIAASALDASTPGDVVGAAVVSSEGRQRSRAILWRDGGWSWLNPPSPALESAALGVSAAGDVVGWSAEFDQRKRSAVLWSEGAAIDLSAAVELPPGERLREAHDVNSAGVIVAALEESDGAQRLALLIPASPRLDLNRDGQISADDLLAALSRINDAERLANWVHRFVRVIEQR